MGSEMCIRDSSRYCEKRDINPVPDTLDEKIWSDIKDDFSKDKVKECEYEVENTHRALGTRLSHYIYKKFGKNALKEKPLGSMTRNPLAQLI